MDESPQAPQGNEESTECLLSSRDADGSVRSIGPFARERGELLVQVYGRMYPSQTCWLEPLPQEVLALHTGRVQRHRHMPPTTSSDRDH